LYEAIVTAWSNFVDWLSGIGQTLNETYGQLGAGIVGGLSALANAIIQFFQSVYDAIVYFSNAVQNALNTLASWISGGLSYIGTGISKIGESLYQFGLQIWNGIVDFVNGFISVIENGINWLINQFMNVYNTVRDWITSTLNGFNTWWTNLIISIRNKIKMTIKTDIMMYFTWKSFDKMTEAKGIFDFIRPIGVLFTSAIMGEIFANVVDTVLPTPSTEPIPLIPTIELPEVTLSPVSIPRLSYGGTPSQPSPMPPVYVGYIPIIDMDVGIGCEYEYSTVFPRKELTGEIVASYETEVA